LVVYELKHPFRDGTTHVLFEPLDLMALISVRHPSGDLRSSKSAVLPIAHRPPGRAGAPSAQSPHSVPRPATPGVLPYALRASLRLFKIAPGDFLAPNARHRRLVVPAPARAPVSEGTERGATPTRAQMTWAQRLRRVVDIDVSRCARCGSPLRVLAAITDPGVIAAILTHLEARAARPLPPVRH
jgi:hypothetical protein